MTTDAEIRTAINERLHVLTQQGNVEVHFGQPDANITGYRFCTDEEPKMDFTITGDATTGFKVFVAIGNPTLLTDLPHLPAESKHRIPRECFVEGDDFLDVYEQVHGAIENLAVYQDICAYVQPQSILEIGVRAGYSAWMMLAGSPTASYRGIDLDKGTHGGVAGYSSKYAESMLRKWYPESDIRVVIGDSQNLTSLPRKYDLIHIDGAHGHDATLHDLLVCAPFCERLLLDDVSHISTVFSALTDFLERYPVPAVYWDSWRGHVLMRPGLLEWDADTPYNQPAWFSELV